MLLIFKPIKANAKNIDYTDYIVADSYVDGVNNLKIRIPIDQFSRPYWLLYNYFTDGLITTYEGDNFYWQNSNNLEAVDVVFNAFYTSSTGDYLLITDIPDGSTLSLHYDIHEDFDMDYYTMYVQWRIQYFDVNYNSLGYQYTESLQADFSGNEVSVVLSKPEGAIWMRCQVEWSHVSWRDSDGEFDLYARAFEFDVSIDAMQREQQLTGQTNKLLEKVNESLNTTVPGASDSINNSNNAQDKLEAAGDALANVPKPPINNVNSSISGYVPTDSAQQTNSFLGALWESELFMTMIILLLTIGTCSYVLFGKR